MDKKEPTILLSALDNYGGHPFDDVFDVVFGCYGIGDMESAMSLTSKVVLIIWGGSDLSPSIYGQKPNKWTGAGEKLSDRDRSEWTMAMKAIELGIPTIGICRGAQLMCCLSGGSLIQHVNGHAGGYHKIVTDAGEQYNCPSLHHQMMFPWLTPDGKEIAHDMLAWTEKPLSDCYLGEPEGDDPNGRSIILPGHEPEVVWFPVTKSLCIQSHPEFIHDMKHPFIKYCLALVKQYVL